MAKTAKQVVSGGYHRPVCPECECEMRPETNGVGVLDMAPIGPKVLSRGTNYEPYQLFDADLWMCPKCRKKVIGGFGQGPIAEHFHRERFVKLVDIQKASKKLYKNYG